MKLHVIVNEQGEVIATLRADAPDQDPNIRLTIAPAVAGHKLYENVEVPDEMAQLEPGELHKGVKNHLPA